MSDPASATIFQFPGTLHEVEAPVKVCTESETDRRVESLVDSGEFSYYTARMYLGIEEPKTVPASTYIEQQYVDAALRGAALARAALRGKVAFI